jgi:RNA polymerase sigma factor for flagellar operon FliA
VLSDEDFLQIGILGLYEAIERFDPERNIKFETYAIPRVRGIIIDEIRRTDWLSRTTRKRSQDYLQAADKLRSEYGREVTSDEIRQYLNITPDEYKTYLRAAAAATSSLSLNDTSKPSNGSDDESYSKLENVEDIDSDNVLTQITHREEIESIAQILQDIPERSRLVMTLYYYESLTFKEIGAILSITESRVCQIHTKVIGTMRKKFFEEA